MNPSLRTPPRATLSRPAAADQRRFLGIGFNKFFSIDQLHLLLKIKLSKTSCAQSKDFHITTVYCKYLPFQILHILYEQKLDNVKSRHVVRNLFPITKDNADLFIISDKCRKYMFEPI